MTMENIKLLINGKIATELNPNSNLQEFAELLFYEFNIKRSDYGPIQFLLNDVIYEDFSLRLLDIGISIDFIIDVKKSTFDTFPLHCTLNDRDNYEIYLDGIKFELSFKKKIIFELETCLASTNKTGNSYIKILKNLLVRTDNPFEVSAIQEIIVKIQNLTQSYVSEIKKGFSKLIIEPNNQ